MRPVQPRATLVRDGLGLSSTDVVLNLFLFFVIAFALIATFKKTKDEKTTENPPAPPMKVIDVPSSSSALGAASEGSVFVELDGQGEVFLDGTSLRRDQLTATLKARLAGEQRPVVLRAAKGIALGDAVELLDLINAASPGTVSLSTVEKTSPQR